MKEFHMGANSFVELDNRKFEDVSIPGWRPLRIQYTIKTFISGKPQVIWNVMGTKHIFQVPLLIINQHHGENYVDHFILTLERLREDYLEWYNMKFPEDWMRDYWEFANFIYKTKHIEQ